MVAWHGCLLQSLTIAMAYACGWGILVAWHDCLLQTPVPHHDCHGTWHAHGMGDQLGGIMRTHLDGDLNVVVRRRRRWRWRRGLRGARSQREVGEEHRRHPRPAAGPTAGHRGHGSWDDRPDRGGRGVRVHADLAGRFRRVLQSSPSLLLAAFSPSGTSSRGERSLATFTFTAAMFRGGGRGGGKGGRGGGGGRGGKGGRGGGRFQVSSSRVAATC